MVERRRVGAVLDVHRAEERAVAKARVRRAAAEHLAQREVRREERVRRVVRHLARAAHPRAAQHDVRLDRIRHQQLAVVHKGRPILLDVVQLDAVDAKRPHVRLLQAAAVAVAARQPQLQQAEAAAAVAVLVVGDQVELAAVRHRARVLKPRVSERLVAAALGEPAAQPERKRAGQQQQATRHLRER